MSMKSRFDSGEIKMIDSGSELPVLDFGIASVLIPMVILATIMYVLCCNKSVTYGI